MSDARREPATELTPYAEIETARRWMADGQLVECPTGSGRVYGYITDETGGTAEVMIHRIAPTGSRAHLRCPPNQDYRYLMRHPVCYCRPLGIRPSDAPGTSEETLTSERQPAEPGNDEEAPPPRP